MPDDKPDEKPDPEATSATAESADTDLDHLITVGVGASAGGLEAFSELLRYLPPTTGMAFVLVQHLDPRHQSVLPELLAGKTQMRVVQVQNDTLIRPDHVYVIPPNMMMRVRDHKLALEARPATQESFKPIDVFLHSLAQEFHLNAVGVVLSGTATDGTLGLKSIKAEGGITFAQNQSAKFDSMPRSAIAAGVVDFVLSPRQIADELVAIARRPAHLTGREGPALKDGTSLHRLLLLLRNATGVDFTQYKQPTVLRRLSRRIVVRKAAGVEEYLGILQKEPEEVKALFDDLLINVTDFFRDVEVFELAKRTAFPSIVQNRKQPHIIRAWIPGCSTGEEVYSMTIALIEFLESADLPSTIQMFGTDVSDNAIEKARAGTYTDGAVLNVSPERLRRFFVRTDSGYQISRSIREMCIFSRHNIAKDPPLSRMDLISCRNLLIYFAPSLQHRIVATFGYALQPGGCLILGSSETLGNLSDYFNAIDEPHKIYSKKSNVSPNVFQISDTMTDYPPEPPRPAERSVLVEPAATIGHISRYVDQIVLSRYGPAGIVVNEHLRVTEHRGDLTEYLGVSEIPRDADLMAVLRPDLRATVSTAIEQARQSSGAVASESSRSDQKPPVVVTAIPLALAGVPRHFLILLGRTRDTRDLPEIQILAEQSQTGPMTVEEENSHLKQELKSTREYLQSVIEELRSTNEEVQSANEELQSTNEEMQTSKEELQASNEELNTINAEMQSRNAELAQMNDDLVNLLGSMNMPIVMTGRDLRIRRFTPTAEKTLRLIATDIGRPIADIKPRINVPDLDEILRHVLDTLQPLEREVQDQEGRSYLMRVRPYRTADDRIDGTVLQLLDISDLKLSVENVKYARDYAETIVNTIREPLAVLDRKLALRDANPAFLAMVNAPREAAVGKTILEVARGRFDSPQLRALLERLKRETTELSDIEVECQPEKGEARTLLVNARCFQAPAQEQLTLLAFEDITERKRAAEARYRRLFESARDGILLVEATSGEIMDLNPFAERLLGYGRQEIVGHKIWEIEPMRNVPAMRTAIERVRDQGVLRIEDLVLRTKDGRELQMETIASLYSEGDRRAIQFNMRDVSERKKFEHELQEVQKLESLGRLAGGIAHDFNNLLTGVLGNASLALSQTGADQPTRMHLREIIGAAERAALLTRQMLAYAGRGTFLVSRIDLGALVREIAPLLRTSVQTAVEIKLDLASNLPPIEGDRGQIEQVVTNLVMNAAEAIPANGPGKVTIRTSLRDINAPEIAEFFHGEQSARGVYVQLEVIDTGAGMNEETKVRVFDPFFTTKFTGRGLGLAAVQGIVRRHGGAVRVYSTPGEGTIFLVLVPVKASVSPAPVAEARPGMLPPGTVVLVIDDEKSIRTLAENVLTQRGAKVLSADNGTLGMELFRQHHGAVSAVILDLQMPVMGGEETLMHLKQVRPDVPVILSSGLDEAEAQRRFSWIKPARFLQKPYTAERLLAAVTAILERKD